jgi:hypothetical protein
VPRPHPEVGGLQQNDLQQVSRVKIIDI